MKKKFLTFILSICLIIPAMFTLSACSTTEDDNVQIRVQDGYVQWSSDNSDWQNVITIDEILDAIGDDITGPQGQQGEQGLQGEQGVAGKQVEFNVSATHIQWRYVGDSAWNNLIALESIKGEKGDDGDDGQNYVEQEITLTLDYNLPQVLSMFDITNTTKYPTSVELNRRWYNSDIIGIWSLPDFVNTAVEPFFKGWFTGVGINERQIYNKEYLPTDTKIYAIWDTEEIYRQLELMEQFDNYSLDTSNKRCVIESLKDETLTTCETPSIFVDNTGVYSVYIKEGCFDNAVNLETLTLGSNFVSASNSISASNAPAFENCVKLTKVVIKDNVKYLEANLFSRCSSLTGIKLSSQMRTLGSMVFAYCSSLKTIYLPESVLSIGDFAFTYSGIEQIYLPSRLTSLGDGIFSNCESLTQITIPSKITTLGDEMFQDCSNLEEVIMPNVNALESRVFKNCKKLSNLDTSNIISMGEETFYGCHSLSQIIIGQNFTTTTERTFNSGNFYTSRETILYCYLYNSNQTLIIDSELVANSLIESSSWGNMLSSFTFGYVYIDSNFDISSSTYLLNNFTKQESSDKDGYDYYIRNNRNQISTSLLESAETVYIPVDYELVNNEYLLTNFEKQETSDEEGFDKYVRNAE